MVRGMIALTVESAKNLAIWVIIGVLVLSVLSAWLIKSVLTKLIVVLLCAGLAFGVWTQRSSLQDCADKAQAKAEAEAQAQVAGSDVVTAPLTCTFFGTDIEVVG
jgi:protein-S-isoprenylcysteine O-methyltransferase Ste14